MGSHKNHLADVPLLGDLLVSEGYLTPQKKKEVEDAIADDKKKPEKDRHYNGKYFGQVAVEMGMEQASLDKALLKQADLISQAATADLKSLDPKKEDLSTGKMVLEKGQIPQYSNHGAVAPANPNPTLA